MHFAVDTETTSLRDPRPIEIAAVKVDDFTVAFCERIRSDVPIDSRAEAVHGISARTLINCRDEIEVMSSFLSFLSTHSNETPIVLVAHNARFDKLVIENALERCKLKFPNNVTWECTMEMSRKKKFKNCKLSECCKRAGIEYQDAHCALPDAIMCARVYKNFFKATEYWEILDEGLRLVNEQEASTMLERDQILQKCNAAVII
jgi:DNA polymerase III epsilon subunit-like protein